MLHESSKDKQYRHKLTKSGLSIKVAWNNRRSRRDQAKKHFEHKPYKADF